MNTCIGIVLAGGKGSRFHGPWPKVLAPINGIPSAVLLVDKLGTVVKTVVVVTNEKNADVLRVEFEETTHPRVIVLPQRKPLGTASAVDTALTRLNDEMPKNVMVVNGDMPLLSLTTIRSVHAQITQEKETPDLVITSVEVPTDHPELFDGFGRIIRRSGKITGIVEANEAVGRTHAIRQRNAGLYGINTGLFQKSYGVLPAHMRGNDPTAPIEFFLPDLVPLARTVGEVTIMETYEALGIDTLEDYERVNRIAKQLARGGTS